GVRNLTGDVAAGDLTARGAKLFVAAAVIEVRRRIDDVADGFGRQRADGREQLVAHVRPAAVDQRDPFREGQRGHVAAPAGQHVEVLAHLRDANVGGLRERMNRNKHENHEGRKGHKGLEALWPWWSSWFRSLWLHHCSSIRGRVLA